MLGTNERGFTLTEILVAFGMLAIIVMTSMQVTNTLINSTAVNDSKQGQIQLTRDLREVLLHKDTCLKSMTTLNFDATRDTAIGVKLANDIVVSGSAGQNNILEYGVRVKTLELTNKKTVTTLPDGNVFSTVLMMESEATKGQQQFQFAPVIVATLFLQVNSANTVVACLTGESPSDVGQLSCNSLGGTLGADGKCRLQAAVMSVSCADGEYLKGFDSSGNKDCRSFATAPVTPTRTCTTQAVGVGAGAGATPRYWPDPCNTSCYGTYGNDTRCAGGCFLGYRDWYYCGNCVRETEVCN